jgi:5-methylcytosine-specific restriction endonuclease McrA
MQYVLTLDNGGRPNHWATWEEAVLLQVKGQVAWHLGEDFEFRGGVCRATGKRTIIQVPSIIAVKNQSFVGKVPFSNTTLFARDDHICCYCATRFPRHQLTREHIVPRSRGGLTHWLNCCACCKSCNERKGNRLLPECGMELVYLPYVPNTAEGLILSGRHILADQMDFLKSCLPKGSRILSR